MIVKGMNQSAIRTRRKIREAFLQMHSEKLVADEMTVSDLVRRAEISRSTFYTHYSSLDDVGIEIINEAISEILGDEQLTDKGSFQAFIERLLFYLQRHQRELGMLMESDFPVIFSQQFKGMVKHRVRAACESDTFLKIRLYIFIDGMLEQFVCFFRHQYSYSLEDLCAAVIIMSDQIFG